MKVLILTHGTRGDVQPFAALAHALHRAGHDPVLAAPTGTLAVAESHGVRCTPLDDGPNRLMGDPEVRAAMDTNYRGLRGKRIAVQVLRKSAPLMARVLDDMAAAAEAGADLVVHQVGIPGHEVAERLGVPAVPVCLQPVWVPTRSFANPMIPVRLPRALNRASYLPIRVALHAFPRITARWRTYTLGLPRRRGHRNVLRRPDGTSATVLQGFSRHLLPTPLDYPESVHTTGFWFLPTAPDWTPPQQLSDFLAAGQPPVYIGFGSMTGTDPQARGRLVIEAVRRAGVRAVIVSGWGGIQAVEPDEDVLCLDQVA
ncbi:glycosyltransferase [Amycolatopsis anabasis]|uniref:glycosyltransferase n=1 Tax=Amycolatopsis anabasis TaxID=1840409 RepID=UPI001FE43C16|nr:glycosyltransferase [Amycolatopsis anabasis]